MKYPLKNMTCLAILFFVFSLSACSGNSEDEEKGSIDQFTKQTAEKAVQHIQAPLDKANAVQVLSDQHSNQIKKAIEEE